LSEDIKELLFGKFPDIKKMKVGDLKEECQMWRNLWSWIPSTVKYYISRTGQTVGVQIRNYQRYVGPLLDTEWELKSIDIGVYDKVYNQVDGTYYYERKISRLPVGQIVSFDWISERMSEEEMQVKMEMEEAAKQPKPQEPQEEKQ
jgi:hypothetical protein